MPHCCYWCGGSFEGLRFIYKGDHQDRHFDSEECLKAAEAPPCLVELALLAQSLRRRPA